MDTTTVRQLRHSPGITTTLVSADGSPDPLVLRRVDLSLTFPWSIDWLDGELEAIRRARLPQVVAARVAERGPDHLDIVRPYVAGLDIQAWAAQHGPLSPNEQVRLASEVFRPLAGLHRLGIAHGGVQAANVIIRADSEEVTLLDACMTRHQLAPVTETVDGPDPRLAPSDARPGRARGFADDLVAAALVLLEALAEANRTASALRRARSVGTEAAQLVDIVGVPALLRPIVLRVLDPSTETGYHGTDEALTDLEALLATGTDMPPAYYEPAFVGRTAELAALTACAEAARGSGGAVACLSGASGLGKSRLLDAVVAQVADAGVTVLRAGAFDHTAARPLGLFAGPLREVVARLTADPREAERVRSQLGGLLAAAVVQVPELAEVFGSVATTAPSTGGIGDRALAAPAAVAALLAAVFTPARPGLLIVDDCQWADDLSWQVLARLAITIAAGSPRSAGHLSLVCAGRPDVVDRVRAWGVDGITYVALAPLSANDTAELVRSISDELPDEVLPFVDAYAKGNPLETLLVFQALVDSAALTREADRWVLAADPPAALLPPRPLDAATAAVADAERDAVLVSSRLDRISPDTRRAVRQAAVLGRRFAPELLAGALSDSVPVVEAYLLEATAHGLVRGIAEAGSSVCEFTHDRVREAVLRALPAEERRELHRRAARALEEADGAPADYDIAYHFHRAGDDAAAAPYALRAGEAGVRQNALDVAAGNFRIVQAGLADDRSDGTARFRLQEGLGTVHMLLGNYDLAAKELVWAYELSTTRSALDSSRVACLLGELSFKTGAVDDSAEWMGRSMRQIGLRLPAGPFLAGLCALGEVGLLALTWAYRRLRPNRSGTERDHLAARIYNRLLYEWWFVRSPIWSVLAILRGMRFANAAGSTRERAQAYSTASVVSGVAPILAPLALQLANHSLRLRQREGDGWGVAQSHHFRGFALFGARRYAEAIVAYDIAIEAFETYGDRWEQVAAKWQKALCLAGLGRLLEAGVLARDTYADGKRRGDRIGAGTALAIWVRCLPGDVGMETILRELRQASPGDRHTRAMLHLARAWGHLHADQAVQALAAFEQAEEVVDGAAINNHFLAPIRTSHMQVRRLVQDASPASWTRQHQLRAAAARRRFVRARLSALVFWSERPPVLREWAIRLFAKGRRRRGRLALAAAAHSAASISATGEMAACAVVASAVGLRPRRGPLSGLPRVAELCRSLGIRVDRGIVESAQSRNALDGSGSVQHQALLDAVSHLVAAEDVDEVLDELRDAVAATTSARRVEVGRPTTAGAPSGAAVPLGVEPVRDGQGKELTLLERTSTRVAVGEADEASIVAAFPVGEGDRHGPTVEVLAALAAAVIEREGLRRRSMERMVAVQEAERGRIALDLHDDFGHIFAGLMDRLSVLRSSDDPVISAAATDAREYARRGIQVARAVAWSLRPSGLDDISLTGSVEQYVEDCRQMYPTHIEFSVTGRPVPVSPVVTTAVFRIVQEALTNIGRHSGAEEASIMLVFAPGILRVVVEDDGIGFDPDVADRGRSLGLVGMRERARLVDATLSVESRPGAGTLIRVEVPLKP
ncbi:AAA family ATPase [Raineyella sp. W15-4]|uniref:AAA family ATPase n=1 Tax=Raineyella sp. W15-4 TaxID=3081651 RepID=UPI002954B2BD|nr:AAA family ATPase [Raineyella sp. W15-4]WOQ16263.1 AAA family ATPase [Raineyella sp. W15-4]